MYRFNMYLSRQRSYIIVQVLGIPTENVYIKLLSLDVEEHKVG